MASLCPDKVSLYEYERKEETEWGRGVREWRKYKEEKGDTREKK